MRTRNAIPRNKREEEDREKALAAVALARRRGLSIAVAAKELGTTAKVVRRYAGSAIRKKAGRYYAKPYDRIPRKLNVITPRGTVPVTVRDSRTASRIAEHMNAVRTYVRKGRSSALVPFKGKKFRAGGKVYMFVTDPAVLDRLGDADALPIEGPYRPVPG